MLEQIPFSEWLEQAYINWQMTLGRRATLGEFAEELEISQGLLSHYLKGIRRPRIGTVHKLAAVLGNEIYTILGYQRPDPRLQYIAANWDKIPQEEQDALTDDMKALVKQAATDQQNDEAEVS